MRLIPSILSSLFISIMLSACSTSAPVDTISEAEAAIASGDYRSARSVEQLVSDTTIDLSPSELCRISLIYMHLAENNKTHYDEDVAVAAQCYLKALQLNRDSVEIFTRTMSVSELPAMNTLNELAAAITSPVNLSDSISNYDYSPHTND